VQLLLDTHALLWWLLGDSALSGPARSAIADPSNHVFVSAASAWEIAIKYKQGKLPAAGRLVSSLDVIVAAQGFAELSITIENGEAAGMLPLLHKDPFDRVLVAQALVSKLMLVSNDTVFDAYGVARLW
jgi:PIN domain nuclease of toxin-antitoxin system